MIPLNAVSTRRGAGADGSLAGLGLHHTAQFGRAPQVTDAPDRLVGQDADIVVSQGLAPE